MAKLSFEEFIKLSESEREKGNRYKDMNDYDRFRARVTQPLGKSKIIGELPMTKNQKDYNEKKKAEIMEKIRINNDN
jgi:hypothetical protein